MKTIDKRTNMKREAYQFTDESWFNQGEWPEWLMEYRDGGGIVFKPYFVPMPSDNAFAGGRFALFLYRGRHTDYIPQNGWVVEPRNDDGFIELYTNAEFEAHFKPAPSFDREFRYLVFKTKTMAECLTTEEIDTLFNLGKKLEEHRAALGKETFDCLVVEKDWPEFVPAWEAIERRMTRSEILGTNAQLVLLDDDVEIEEGS